MQHKTKDTPATRGKLPWEAPRIVMERSLVAKAQEPFLGEVNENPNPDPFLGAFSASQ